jgi:hypothetical protein
MMFFNKMTAGLTTHVPLEFTTTQPGHIIHSSAPFILSITRQKEGENKGSVLTGREENTL